MVYIIHAPAWPSPEGSGTIFFGAGSFLLLMCSSWLEAHWFICCIIHPWDGYLELCLSILHKSVCLIDQHIHLWYWEYCSAFISFLREDIGWIGTNNFNFEASRDNVVLYTWEVIMLAEINSMILVTNKVLTLPFTKTLSRQLLSHVWVHFVLMASDGLISVFLENDWHVRYIFICLVEDPTNVMITNNSIAKNWLYLSAHVKV